MSERRRTRRTVVTVLSVMASIVTLGADSTTPRGSGEGTALDFRQGSRARTHRGSATLRGVLASGDSSRFIAALSELARDPRPEARDRLLDAMLELAPLDRRQIALQRSWAQSFVRGFGLDAAEIAERRLQDQQEPPFRRGLFLQAHHVAVPGDRSTYASYLHDPSRELRRAALYVNRALWDYDALPSLLQLENGFDPVVRREARELARRYLLWGVLRPTPEQRAQANRGFEPHRPQEFRLWRFRRAEWEARQAALESRSFP